MNRFWVSAHAGFGTLIFALAASAAPLNVPGLYQLHNHPNGGALPPPYGARFDELFDVTPDHDIFSLNFDAVGSDVRMQLTSNTIHIFGSAFGGRDIGTDYANDVYKGFYQIDFLYTVGVGPVPGDDDFWAAPASDHSNFGTLTAPNGLGVTNLTDQNSGSFSIRIGDDDNDLGYRGFPGISGWGWFAYIRGNDIFHVDALDWLFTAEPFIPAPVRRA